VRPQGEELWVEVTLPKKGPPRQFRLGVKKREKARAAGSALTRRALDAASRETYTAI